MAANLSYNQKQSEIINSLLTISLEWDIDESNQDILVKLLENTMNDEKIRSVVFNLEKLDYINSWVIGLFALWHGKYTEVEKTFVFANANDHIYDIIDLVWLDSVIDYFPTVKEAVLSFED